MLASFLMGETEVARPGLGAGFFFSGATASVLLAALSDGWV